MWLERQPKRDALMDVPAAAEVDGSHWAELRISATTFRSLYLGQSGRDETGGKRQSASRKQQLAACLSERQIAEFVEDDEVQCLWPWRDRPCRCGGIHR